MTDQQYTPTMDRIRNDFIEAWSGHFMDGALGAAEYFDRALDGHNARIEAAAEQRGAAEALREVANMSDAWQNLFRKDVSDQKAYMLAWRIRIALHNRADTYRADLLEGDDE